MPKGPVGEIFILQLQVKEICTKFNFFRTFRECSHLTACAIYQKLEDKVPVEPHGMAELVPQVLDHLTTGDMDFFNRWSLMNSLESGEAKKGSKLKTLWYVHTTTTRHIM